MPEPEAGENDGVDVIRQTISVTECGVVIDEENWFRRFVIPLKGLVDGVADNTKTRSLSVYRRLTIDGSVYFDDPLSSGIQVRKGFIHV